MNTLRIFILYLAAFVHFSYTQFWDEESCKLLKRLYNKKCAWMRTFGTWESLGEPFKRWTEANEWRQMIRYYKSMIYKSVFQRFTFGRPPPAQAPAPWSSCWDSPAPWPHRPLPAPSPASRWCGPEPCLRAQKTWSVCAFTKESPIRFAR